MPWTTATGGAAQNNSQRPDASSAQRRFGSPCTARYVVCRSHARRPRGGELRIYEIVVGVALVDRHRWIKPRRTRALAAGVSNLCVHFLPRRVGQLLVTSCVGAHIRTGREQRLDDRDRYRTPTDNARTLTEALVRPVRSVGRPLAESVGPLTGLAEVHEPLVHVCELSGILDNSHHLGRVLIRGAVAVHVSAQGNPCSSPG